MRKTAFFLFLLIAGITTSVISSSFANSSSHISEFMKKKKKKKKKKEKKKKPPKSNCNPSSLKRTTADSIILKKYVALYKDLGGVCYIKKLQEMGDIEKTGTSEMTGESCYTVYLGKSKTPDDRMAWTTFMYCPIGKPDGFVALVQPSGDTVQYCTYKSEKKEGKMVWLKPRYGIIANFDFINDEKPVEVVQDYDPNAQSGGGTQDQPPVYNRTDDTSDSLR
jgi:hypothetical protein